MLNGIERHREWGITALRVVVGIIFLAHGYQKLFMYGIGGVSASFGKMGIPLPDVSAVLATSAEAIGGLLLLVGLFTRYAAIPLAITMIVAILQVHLRGGFFAPAGFEYPLSLLGASVALFFLGSGPLAVDNVIHHPRGEEHVAGVPVRA